MKESEAWFQRYLRENGYDGADEHEPDLGISRRPDFVISRGGASAVCEIKQFDDATPLDRKAAVRDLEGRPLPFTAGDNEVYGPIRQQVHAAARQMRELDGRGTPLVAVLANPSGRMVHLDVPFVIHALYGNPTFGGPYNPRTGTIEHIGSMQGRDGELTMDHRYLSAVVLLHRRRRAQDLIDQWRKDNRTRLNAEYPDRRSRAVALYEGLTALDAPEGDYFFVDVIHTTSARIGNAPLLSAHLFDGPKDRHWVANPDGTYSEVSSNEQPA